MIDLNFNKCEELVMDGSKVANKLDLKYILPNWCFLYMHLIWSAFRETISPRSVTMGMTIQLVEQGMYFWTHGISQQNMQ